MRIPPSVIVMTLVTAVPFALAVHDTMKPHAKTYEEMTDEEREAKFEADMQKEAAEQAARDAAATAKIAATDRTFFGAKPGQLGSFFGTVHLGSRTDDPAVDALSARMEGPNVSFEGTNVVDSFAITDEEHCSELREALVAAWPESPSGVYLDPQTHQRASFHDCTVRFDRYVDVNQWFDRKGAPVALSLVGMSADKLRETLGGKLTNDDGEVLMWTEPGIGNGTGPTRLTARVENDKIIGVSVNVLTDSATVDAVHARLDGLLGKSATDEDGQLVWKGKVPVMLTAADDALDLELGK